MKRFVYGLALLLSAPFVFSLSVRDLTSVLDPGVTLASLSAAAAAGRPLPGIGKFVVLTGVVQSLQILDKNEDGFRAEIELVEGQWHGSDSISLYRCIVEVSGPAFFARIPARPNPQANDPQIILTNERVLVLGEVEGTRVYPDGSVVPVIVGSYVRGL